MVRVGQLETQLYDACLGTENASDPNGARGKEAAEGIGNGKEEGKGEGEDEKKRDEGEEDAEMEEGRAGLYGMLLQLCSELHKHLRPRVFHGTDMDTLCEVGAFVAASFYQ